MNTLQTMVLEHKWQIGLVLALLALCLVAALIWIAITHARNARRFEQERRRIAMACTSINPPRKVPLRVLSAHENPAFEPVKPVAVRRTMPAPSTPVSSPSRDHGQSSTSDYQYFATAPQACEPPVSRNERSNNAGCHVSHAPSQDAGSSYSSCDTSSTSGSSGCAPSCD